MGALNSVPFCSRSTPDDNNNLGDRPDLNLSDDEAPVCGVVVEAQPEATSTPKTVRVEESGDVAIVHGIQPARVHTTPPPYNSMDGDSGLEHSADDDQEDQEHERFSENSLEHSEAGEEVDLNGTLSEENEDETRPEAKRPAAKSEDEESSPVHKDKVKVETANTHTSNINKEKIDFAQLEEEILGDDMVEPITDTTEETLVDDMDITESTGGKLGMGKRNTNTTDMITDMLNQMVVDGGSRDVATR